MKDRNSQLGRTRSRERLTKEEIASLEKSMAAPASAPAPNPPTGQNTGPGLSQIDSQQHSYTANTAPRPAQDPLGS